MAVLWPFMVFDLVLGLFMLTQAALFAELVYPLLTFYGILLAVQFMAWFSLGRFMVTLFIPKDQRLIVLPWLWLCTVPFYCAGLILWGREDGHSLLWNSVNIGLSVSLWFLAQAQLHKQVEKERLSDSNEDRYY